MHLAGAGDVPFKQISLFLALSPVHCKAWKHPRDRVTEFILKPGNISGA